METSSIKKFDHPEDKYILTKDKLDSYPRG